MHAVNVASQDEVLQIFRRAGFSARTPFQEKLMPLVLRARDVAAEARAGAGITVGFVLPLMLGLRGAGTAPRAVILVPTSEEVGKVARAYSRFSRVVRDAPPFVPLGEIEDARREQRRLEKGATVVAGTTERVIDHIRRGSLAFDELQTIIVREPDADALADFVKDVQFIFAKIADRRQTILLSRSPLAEENELQKLLRHPIVVEARDSGAVGTDHGGHLFFTVDRAARADLLVRILLGFRVRAAMVYHSPRSDARSIEETLRARGLRASALSAGGGSGGAGGRQQAERRNALQGFSRNELDVLLVALPSGGPAASGLEDLVPSHVVYLDLPTGSSRPAGLATRARATVMAMLDRGQDRDLARLQEAIGVTMNRGEIPSDDEVLTGAIDRVLRRMKGEDHGELVFLRSRIRRQVPFLQRPLFMASLLKSFLPPLSTIPATRARPAAGPQQPSTPAGGPALSRGQRGRFGRSAETQPAGGRPARRGGEFTQLFVSIGRNRRVYARDLTELFTEKLQLGAGDIGGVRVFEKYSFVDIAPGKAGEAIARLSGVEVKGRTITVNYAKKKEEKEGT